MAADVGFLASHLGLPEPTLATTLSQPTVELVQALLGAVAAKAAEFQNLEAEKLNLGIELEGAIRGSETRCEQFKADTEKALNEVEELRQKLRAEETARQILENELQTLKLSRTTSQSEIETLRARIASLEASNRDTLAIVDSKTQANENLSDELQKQHQKILKLKQEVSSLSQSLQTAQAASSSAKFREESLQQQLDLAKRNNEWYENELKTKSAEALKTRKEKGARIAELQRLLEDANANIESLTKSEQQLRKRLDEAQKKADDSWIKVQQLQEFAARAEESFKQEIEASKRLVQLKDQQSETHRNRLKEVELRLEQVKDDGADEIRRVRRDVEQEKEYHVELDQRIQELETENDQLKAALKTHVDTNAVTPHTPRANGSFFGHTDSPFGTPGSFRGKSSVRASDALDQLYKVRGQLEGEKRERKRLQEHLDELTSILEVRGPEMEELNAENERLRNETIQMSEIMQQSFEDRDAAVKMARKAESTASSAQAEVKMLRDSMRDLSMQVGVFVTNARAAELGMDQLTPEEMARYEQFQRGEISEEVLQGMSDTHQFITEKFVLYKDVHELQTKNMELLRITRELADKMENEEALAAKQQAVRDHEDVKQLRGTVSILQDEVKSITVRMKSYMTERDMFRRMLQQRANSAEIQAVLGSSVDGNREVLASIENPEDPELAVALRELQAQFDSYRNDATTDRKSLTDQIDRLSSEKSALQAQVSRVSSQLTLATERYSMLESNFKAVQLEKQELQKRSQSLSELTAKQEIKTQQVAEDLVEAKGLVESMRSENANLKAEKMLWKSIQDRLGQDNETLAQEKARLSTVVSNQQSLLNERELAEAESTRRLQGQIDVLDAELAATKRKLSEETEESKKMQLRKEFDAQQYQKRMDELSSTLSQIKEDSVALKTSRDHLQARVNELEIEIRNAQERAERLRPLSTPRAQAGADDDAEARIHELEQEVADVKSNLEVAHSQLEHAKQQNEQQKQLNRELEDELSSITEAQEQYRQEMDQALASKETTIKDLQQRAEGISTELSSRTHELNELRDSQAEVARKFDERERMLKTEIDRMKEEEDRYKQKAKFHHHDLRAQADIAARAQEDYEQELVKHAEAAKSLQQLRAQHNELKTEASSLRAEAQSAKMALTQGEQSWEERQQQYEEEISELKTRREDANNQNKLLHQQLENVTAQISSLQERRAAVGDTQDGPPAALADPALEGMRELNRYLRQEKEILEVQFGIKTQEATRQQQQIEYLQSQLDEAQLKLEQERRAQSDSSRNSLTHQELMDKLNEINLLRESNVTLRNENSRTQKQMEARNMKIDELEARIQPLEGRIAELELDKQFKEAEIAQLQEDRDRSQKRIESILSKYGQSDPEEIEQLKKQIAELETERDGLRQTQATLEAKVTEVETAHETDRNNWNSHRDKLKEQFKTRYGEMKAQRDDNATQREQLKTELDTTKTQLAEVEKKLETLVTDKSTLEKQNSQLQEALEAATAARQETGETGETSAAPPVADDPQQVQELMSTLHQLQGQLATVKEEKALAEQERDKLQSELDTTIAERDAAQTQAQTAAGSSSDPQAANNESEAATGVTVTADTALTDEERKALEQRAVEAEQQAAIAEAKATELETHIEGVIKQRSEKMKETLNKKLVAERKAMQQQVQAAQAKAQEDFEVKLKQERAIWHAEAEAGSLAKLPASAPEAVSEIGVPFTPTQGAPSDLSKLTDMQIRDFVAANPTIKGIINTNVRKRVEIEVEAKISSAREQTTSLVEKKSALRINMLDRQVKTAHAKLEYVSTAAKDTPQRPVVEVWEAAKDLKPPPNPAPAIPPASAQNQKAQAVAIPSAAASAPKSAPTVPIKGPTSPNGESKSQPQPVPSSIPQILKLASSAAPNIIPAATGATVSLAHNNFATGLPAPPAHHPFGGGLPVLHQPQPMQQQQAQGQPARSAIPIPNNGRGGNGARGGRGGNSQGGPGAGGSRGGQAFSRGRGGYNRGGANMNPQAAASSPSASGANKRPRNEDGSNPGGPKRQRGGGQH